MKSFTQFRPSAAIAAAAMAFLTACGTDTSNGPTGAPTPSVTPQVLAGNSFVIVSDFGAGVGGFTNYLADNSGRAETEFWDNRSADFGGVEKCNVGFYAAGAIDPSCINDASGSDAGSVAGVYTQYLADGSPRRDATSFMFNGSGTYTVTLKGSYAGQGSEVGWFTKSGSTYKFNKVDGWSNRTVGTTVTINTLGQDWGFYIKNDFNTTPDGCGPKTHCSDAEGGFTGTFGGQQAPTQQFALFTNATGNKFLIGAEDNKLELLPNGASLDSDYQDFVWEIEASRICDFMTFGRQVIASAFGSVVISGNAGGFKADGSILGTFNIQVSGKNYMLQDITSYGAITDGGPLTGLTNARVITGTSRHRDSNGEKVELRIYDGGEPGRTGDVLYLKTGSTVILGQTALNRGNIQYHPTCRGPGDE